MAIVSQTYGRGHGTRTLDIFATTLCLAGVEFLKSATEYTGIKASFVNMTANNRWPRNYCENYRFLQLLNGTANQIILVNCRYTPSVLFDASHCCAQHSITGQIIRSFCVCACVCCYSA